MYQETFAEIPMETPTQSRINDISLIRAALFGMVAPSLLATLAFLLIRADNWTELPFPFFLLFMFIQMSLLMGFICSPFGALFAVLCGLLARTWLRRGNSLTDIQARISSMGAMCGLGSLWGVGVLLNGGRLSATMPDWPASFWGAAFVVGAICGWLLPRVAQSRKVVGTPAG
jgi:hypothetical protein